MCGIQTLTGFQLNHALALLLLHDHLLTRNGISTSSGPLKNAVQAHKARLSAEFTRARIRRGHGTTASLRAAVNKAHEPKLPRWVRINTLRTNLNAVLSSPQFSGYTAVGNIVTLFTSENKKVYYADPIIPNVLGFPPSTDLTTSELYLTGHIILQDRSSCFPAQLLSPPPGAWSIDATAAPGNKTTHLAALLATPAAPASIIAFEKDPRRAEVLKKMVSRAGGDACISIRAGEDFLKADPRSKPLKKVTHLLLDPSCSGSGIVTREEYSLIPLAPPEPPGKKRKRPVKVEKPKPVAILADADPDAEEETPQELATHRLASLAEFQKGMVLHAMVFPAARKITYSTCSVHPEENEDVVMAVLASKVARRRGWRVETREEGALAAWERRGLVEKCGGDEVVAQACVRCNPIEDGGIGFFVVAFVRDGSIDAAEEEEEEAYEGAEDEEEWGGFGSDNDAEEVEETAPKQQKIKQQPKQQPKQKQPKEQKPLIRTPGLGGAYGAKKNKKKQKK